MVKIRVSDDTYLESTDAEKNLCSKYAYTNNNFSYAGSFSSLSSSSQSSTSSKSSSSKSCNSTTKVIAKQNECLNSSIINKII